MSISKIDGEGGHVNSTGTSYRILGSRVHAATIEELHRLIAEFLERREQLILSSQNLHSLRLAQQDQAMHRLHEASHPRIDGMPIVWIGRLLGHPLRREQRVTWIDWLPALIEVAADRHWRVFYLGAREEVVKRGASVLRAWRPDLDVDVHHGYFDASPESSENQAVVDAIRAYRPDLLLVGMGMPRQERWILQNRSDLPDCAILTCGAAIDYVASETRTPPRWLGRLGLEWLARLADDPVRLWRRYLLEPWPLLPLLVRHVCARRLGKRRSKAEPPTRPL